MEKVKTDKYHLILVVEVRYNKAVCKEKYLFSPTILYKKSTTVSTIGIFSIQVKIKKLLLILSVYAFVF